MTKEHIIESIKIAIGVVLAVFIAKALNMQFYTSVATIVIVSMLSAKKQSLKLATTRILAAIISLTLASILFSLLGFTFGVFILYILIFTYLMFKFDMKVAIVLNVVLVMHILTLGKISAAILVNEFALMVLGSLVALIINIFNINIEDELVSYQSDVENLLNDIFKNMGSCLKNECRTELVNADLDKLDDILSKSKLRAYTHMNSYYIQENNYYVEYFSMRRRQYHIVKSMQKFIKLKFLEEKEVRLLKNFTDNFVNNTKVIDACETQIAILEDIKHHFTHDADLPQTHTQLQNRIALHKYLYSLVDLVNVKMRFIEKYEKNRLEM